MFEFSIPFVVTLMLISIGVAYLSYVLEGEDKFAEEMSEEVIEQVSGLDIDLTPHSKE
jgi:hypothetical protein